jgi:transposase
MQGKEASEQETKVKSSVGIDVSKDWLEVHVLPSGAAHNFANTPLGIRQLKRWLSRLQVDLVVIEATGKWHRLVWRSLHASGIVVAMIDPFKARSFAKAQGILAKTDRLDAMVLARFAALMSPAVRPPPPHVLEELAELVAGRDAAVAEQTALKNQLVASQVSMLRRQLQKRIDRLDEDIKQLEREIHARIKADPGLERRYTILLSVPGIGKTVAATLIARLAELGSLTDKQITMLAGLARSPINPASTRANGSSSAVAAACAACSI